MVEDIFPLFGAFWWFDVSILPHCLTRLHKPLQKYDNFQERQKHTLINRLFWREWNLPFAQFLSVENNSHLKNKKIVLIIEPYAKGYYQCCFCSIISSVVYLRCRMQFSAKPMNKKRFWSCLLSNGGRNCSKWLATWPLLILNEVWLPLHPTKGIKDWQWVNLIIWLILTLTPLRTTLSGSG